MENLTREPWPNKLGFDIFDGDTCVAEVCDDPVFPVITVKFFDSFGDVSRVSSIFRRVEWMGEEIDNPIPKSLRTLFDSALKTSVPLTV